MRNKGLDGSRESGEANPGRVSESHPFLLEVAILFHSHFNE